jgi:aspartyl-tRNA(Asn)/glutamyl-tRNA(Gln) amidotransferase subunit A
MANDPLFRPLAETARDLREKRVTAGELVEAAIARHERFGEKLHAYSHWAPEQARAVAQAADAAFAAGVSAGPLQGVPVSIKDLFAAFGYPCFAGSSRRLPADPWERDGPLVATLRRHLGVIMGKTHMVECLRLRGGQAHHPRSCRRHSLPCGGARTRPARYPRLLQPRRRGRPHAIGGRREVPGISRPRQH